LDGENNPVFELWNHAQTIWGPELEHKVQCLVSVGTGTQRHGLNPFSLGLGILAFATETEGTAERFRQGNVQLDNSGRYFRFNVLRGLENIGLKESHKKPEIAAATRDYVQSQDVFKQMQACANIIAQREC
jgi:hypothetical protein